MGSSLVTSFLKNVSNRQEKTKVFFLASKASIRDAFRNYYERYYCFRLDKKTNAETRFPLPVRLLASRGSWFWFSYWQQ